MEAELDSATPYRDLNRWAVRCTFCDCPNPVEPFDFGKELICNICDNVFNVSPPESK